MQIVNIPLSSDKKNELAGYLTRTLKNAVTARTTQVEDKYRRWMDNYAGKPYEPIRTTPFYRASNWVPQLIRMHTDILAARMTGIVFGTRPLWKPRTFLDSPHEWLESIQEWLELVSFFDLGLFQPLDSTISRTIKSGLTILKSPWVDDTSYLGQPGNASGGYKTVAVGGEGLKLFPVPFDDFWVYPITSNNLDEAKVKFHRIRLTKEEVLARRDANLWDKDACEKLLLNPTEQQGAARESMAIEAGVQLTKDVTRPYNVIEAWLDYPITNDYSKPYKIVITFNPDLGTGDAILRSYFNYYTRGIDPFIDFRFFPRDDLFYGYSVPEILEQSQEEQAQIHNCRRDASTIQNIPGWKKRRYANVPNPASEWYPGKVFELDNLDDLQPLQFQVTYNSMIEEEKFILQLAEAYTGIGPAMQAFGAGVISGKRGIYNSQGTLAVLAEGNRRLDIYLKRLRFPFHKLGNLIYQSYRDFKGDKLTYTRMGENGQNLEKTFRLVEPNEFKGLFFDIAASDAGVNKETDRSALLLMANTMASYYRQVLELSNLAAQSPPQSPIHQVVTLVLEGAKDLADRLLFAFDIGDRKRLVPDVGKLLGGGPPTQPSTPEQGGMPAPEGNFSLEQLQNLQTGLAALQSGPGAGNGSLQR